MQVFDIYTYNLKNIKFKDNKDYFDHLLGELDLRYTDVGFCFKSDFDGLLCEKVVKQLPNLEQYKQCIKMQDLPQEYRMSSISAMDNDSVNLHIDRSHVDDLSKLLKKIPRPINFTFMGVILDNIDWYGDLDFKPCFTRDYNGEIFIGHDFTSYYSNSIRFVKEFDYGNKLNLVRVLIERIGDFEKLMPLSQKFEEFCRCFGKPMSKETVCVFDDEENARLQLAGESVRTLIKTAHYDELFIEFKQYCSDRLRSIAEAMDSFSPIQGYSPKNLFKSVGKWHGFRYTGYTEGRYELQKVNVNNHRIKVTFFIRPFSSLLSAEIYVCGYNFQFCITELPTVSIDGELQTELYAKKVFDVADMIENEFFEKLFAAYGKTPDWYEM